MTNTPVQAMWRNRRGNWVAYTALAPALKAMNEGAEILVRKRDGRATRHTIIRLLEESNGYGYFAVSSAIRDCTPRRNTTQECAVCGGTYTTPHISQGVCSQCATVTMRATA